MRVTLILTHRCNMACDYCYAGHKFNRAMPYEMGLKALQMAFRAPREQMVGVSFFGGEPMLEFPLLARLTRTAADMARRAERPVEFSLTTNATVLTDKHLDFFRHYGFFVSLSVDGLGEIQDRYRPLVGGRPSAELVWGNIERACDRIQKLHILMVVSPGTLEGLPAAIERLYRLGVSRISLLPNLDVPWSAADRERVLQVYSRLAEITFASMATEEALWLSPFAELHPQRALKGAPCSFGEKEVAVSPLGRLYPCARLVGTDTRPEVQIGDLENGIQMSRVQEMKACSNGDGGCACVPHMPGSDEGYREAYRFFGAAAGRAAEAAWEKLRELVAA